MKTLFLFLCIVLLCAQAPGQSLPSGFSMSSVSSGSSWSQPVGAAFTKDGLKLFVWEQNGRVYVCNRQPSGNYAKQSTPMLDISDEVGGWRDFGLLGFALDPEFASNGYIYVLYVVDRHHLMTDGVIANGYNPATNDYFKATIGRVTRYTTTTTGGNLVAIPVSRKILIGESKSTGMPILHESHGVGSLAFAADGTLLITCGDGASYNVVDGGSISHTYYSQALTDGIIRPEENVGAFRSQMLNSHNGKLLRINPENGDGVSSNPFYDASAPRSPKSRVWALGFRNPFRMSVKPGSGSTNPTAGDIGEVFVGDVGWGTWEEQNIVKAPGTNFGWPLFEGHTPESGYTALNTQNGDEPNAFGPCNGRTHFRFKDLLRQDNAAKNKSVYNPCNGTELIGSHNRYIHARPSLDWRHGQNIARVGKFDVNGVAINPTIGTPASETVGSPFGGNCSAGGVWYTGVANSFPPAYKNSFIAADYGGQWIRKIAIDYTDVVTKVDGFGTGMGAVVFLAENPLDGTLVCVNVGGNTVRKISYGGNIPPIAKVNADNYYSPATSFTVNFDGTGSFDQDGSIASYSWNFGDPGSPGNTSTSPTPAHTFSTTTGPKKFTVQLTVTDNGGASTTQQFIVSVNNTPPAVNITSPVNNSKYKVAEDSLYDYTATVTDTEHGAPQLTYEWQTTLQHNNHQHPEAIDPLPETSGMISRIGCNGDDYSWLITLKVTDAAGLSSIDSSQIYPDCAGTLPIFLHKFSVTQNGSFNLIRWTTELESNMEYFELERSSNGINFQPINRQEARNNPGTSQYSYADNNFSPGMNYYRLKIVEHGAIIRYSMIVKTVSENENNQLRIAPNPVTGNFSLTYYSLAENKITIEINDISGRLIHTLREEVNKGQNVIYIQSSPDWYAGVYFISIKEEKESKQVKFLKVQ
jgi:glucose/arabinose dehydrogenase